MNIAAISGPGSARILRAVFGISAEQVFAPRYRTYHAPRRVPRS